MNQNTYNVFSVLLYISTDSQKSSCQKIANTMTKPRILKRKIILSQLFLVFKKL